MARTPPRIFTQIAARPYKHALRFYDSDRRRMIVEVATHSALPDLIVSMLTDLQEWQPDILQKVATKDSERYASSSHRSRRYIALDQGALYPDSQHLTGKYSRKVGDYWIATNIGKSETYAFLATIVAASGLQRQPFSELKI
jgi:hypothetical protein